MNIDFTNVSKHYAARSHADMQPVLMKPGAEGPAVHYHMIRGGTGQKNITVWEPGTVGGEYIKTFGHYHVGELAETYWGLVGEGLVLLQKMASPEVVADFKIVPLKAGESVPIPVGYGHLGVNTGSSFLVTADDSPVDFGDPDPSGKPSHADYEPVKARHGFAYYVVEHEGQPALVKNPAYREVQNADLAGLEIIG